MKSCCVFKKKSSEMTFTPVAVVDHLGVDII